MIKIRNILVVSLTIFLFTGCITLTEELPSYKTYSLNLKNSLKSFDLKNKSLAVLEPKTLGSLNSKAIIYTMNNKKEQYAFSKYSDKPTKMLQHLISKALTQTNNFKYVTSSNRKIEADYILNSELVDFQQQFIENSSYAIFSIRVFLIDDKNDKVYFKNFEYKQKTATNNASGYIEAINISFNEFLEDLNHFIYKNIKKAK